MLILSRKTGESLILDGGIEIKITEVYGDKVRILRRPQMRLKTFSIR